MSFLRQFLRPLAECVHQLIDNNHYGIYNISSDKRISKFEFAMLVTKVFGQRLACKAI